MLKKNISCLLFAATVFGFLISISCNAVHKTSAPVNLQNRSDIQIADSILRNILKLYSVPKYGLLSETYPVNPGHRVDYLAEGSVQRQNQEVSFLWPYSGLISGVVSLYKETGRPDYLELLEGQLLPGLELYSDGSRQPLAYQSYPVFAGHSDRFYDDNVWLAIDFCTLYEKTKNKEYLNKSRMLYHFIYSGWDDKLGGGIYWCEQKKESKNTCSNAPSVVLCAKLYLATKDEEYLNRALAIYRWTKEKLRDLSDHVYWDNVSLGGKIDKTKYSYNSGQMIEGGALLYKITGEKSYLQEAQETAAGVYGYFVKEKPAGGSLRPFYPSSPWFNTILLRGLKALREIDGDDKYIETMRANATYAWNNTLDENGLFGNSWHEPSKNKYKWLLDNACMIELFSELSAIK